MKPLAAITFTALLGALAGCATSTTAVKPCCYSGAVSTVRLQSLPVTLEDGRTATFDQAFPGFTPQPGLITRTLPFDEVPWEFAGCQSGGETQRLSLSYFFSYTPPHVLNPKTPEELERIVYRCITVQDYGLPELQADLEAFISKA